MTTAPPLSPPDAAAQLRRPAVLRATWLLAALGILALVCIASLAFGTREVTFDAVFAALSGNTDGYAEAAVVKRIPRTVLGILVGAALAMAGATLQAVTRNPLAEPGILGVTSGAALAVVIGIVFFGISNPYGTIGLATLGAAGASVFVYAIGSTGRGGATPLKLALAGAATTAACMSLVSAFLLPRVDALETFRFWQIGGIGGAEWDRIAVVAPFLGLGAIIVLATSRGMNTLALGDELAAGLGENVARTRLIAASGAVILCGAATAVAGPIAFVGLVVPHAGRLLLGPDQRWLLPFSAVGGAALLLIADIIGRVVARPEEVAVGIITAVVGAPFFIWIVRRAKVREL